MTRPGVVGTLVWTVLVAVAAVIVARARYTTDLSAFLPHTPTATQRLLVDQLRDGLASRLIIVAIEGTDSRSRARLSMAVAARLRSDRQFASVNNGESTGTDRDRAFLFDHRYVLSDTVTPQRFTVEGLKDAIQDTIDMLASPAGLLVKELLPHDPTGEMVEIVGQVGGGSAPRTTDGVWVSGDGKRALIVAQTRALGSDTDGQQRAVEAIRTAFAAAVAGTRAATPVAGSPSAADSTPSVGSVPAATSAAVPTPAAAASQPPALLMSGPGVFAVAARATIIKEVTRLSILSTAIIVALLLGVYRSLPALVLGLVPVASGALAGVAAVALGVGVVHGITLGFGITLIGEAVDYSIYLFIQSQQRSTDVRSNNGGWLRSVWPTIRLGMLTSVCGFASLLPSGFAGLQQLGIYSIGGLVAAALVTRFVLPHWLPRNFSIRDVSPVGVAVSRVLQRIKGAPAIAVVLAIVAGAIVYLHRDRLWNHELSALSPVSLADQDLDAQLRVDIRAPDVRYLVVVSAPDEESLLEAAEKVGAQLDQLIDRNVIGGFDSPAHYLPSLASQRARLASLPPEDELRERLQKSVEGMPVRAERLEPFLTDVAQARAQAPITRKDLDNTSLATGFDALMQRRAEGWIALLPLRASASTPSYIDDGKVRSAVETAAPGRAIVLDIKGEADTLYSTYLLEAVRLSLAGFAAIVILLLIALRSAVRVVRVVIPLALAVLTVVAGFALVGHQLTLLHVIGMLLIVAVGSNYALFFDRRATEAHPGSVPLTLASLVIANLATVVSFGILAFSTVPVLEALGSTVAPGALLALIFSALLARHLPAPARMAPG
jgi:predicted exporter